MSNRELVIDLVQKLPEDAPLLEIAREIEFIDGVHEGLAEADRDAGTPAEQVKARIDSWATRGPTIDRLHHQVDPSARR